MMSNVPLGGDILVDMIDRVAGEYTYGDSIENIVFQQFNAISVQGPAAISNWIKASTKGMSQKERDIYNERANKNAIRALKSASRVTGLPKVGFDLYEIVKKYTQKNK